MTPGVRAAGTLENVVEKAQVSVGMVSFIETGKRRPSLHWLGQLGAGARTPLPILPDIPGIEVRTNKRQDITPIGTASVAAALEVPQNLFKLHFRFRG
jgi:hypothetical protein